MDMTVAF